MRVNKSGSMAVNTRAVSQGSTAISDVGTLLTSSCPPQRPRTDHHGGGQQATPIAGVAAAHQRASTTTPDHGAADTGDERQASQLQNATVTPSRRSLAKSARPG